VIVTGGSDQFLSAAVAQVKLGGAKASLRYVDYICDNYFRAL